MEEVLRTVKQAVQLIVEKFALLYRALPSGVLQLTGVLGLAAVVAGYVHLRGNPNPNPPRRPAASASPRVSAAPAGAASTAAEEQPATRGAETPQPVHAQAKEAGAAAVTARGRLVRKHLTGVKSITISTLGVLLREQTCTELQEGAQVVDEAVELLKELLQVADVFLITHVVDDVGEAVVAGALEAAGLVGSRPDCIKHHRLLFCSTSEGKVSMVRQLEPDLHIDAHASTVEDLKRFMPHLLHIWGTGRQEAVKGPNIAAAQSLSAFFV